MKSSRIIAAILTTIVLLTGACAVPGILSPSEPAQPVPGLADTQAAQTAAALVEQQLVETVRAKMNITPMAKTQQAYATATLAPSSTPLTPSPSPTRRPPTSTPLPPTATEEPCNAAHFIADVTIPDGEILKPNQAIVKTWGLQNVGSCIWTEDYRVVLSSGEPMGAPEGGVKIGRVVLPGQYVNVSVPLITPEQPGQYISNFKLITDTGAQFGVGSSAQKPFWVRLHVVVKGTDPGVVYELAKDYCKAEWNTAKINPLGCPSQYSDDGAVFLLTRPKMENGYVDDEPTIVMFPDNSKNGYVQGIFPTASLRAGNHFKAIIGCLANSDDCTVTFELHYTLDGSSLTQLGSWVQKEDGKIQQIDVDLSELAGKQPHLVLRVLSNGDSTEDRAFWLAPRITR